MASRIQIPLAWLTSRLQTCKDRDKMTRFFLFFSLFPNAVGVVWSFSLSFIIRRCHNRFRCHLAIIIVVSLSPSLAAVVIVVLIVIVFVVVASKEEKRVTKEEVC